MKAEPVTGSEPTADSTLTGALAAAVALSLVSIAMFMASASRIPVVMAVALGVVLALLPIYGLKSLGPARAALGVQAVGLFALIRLLAVPGADPSWVLPWSAGLVATLVLVGLLKPDEPQLPGSKQPGRAGRTARAVAVVAAMTVLLTVLLGPQVAERLRTASSRPGNEASVSGTVPPLLARDSLDMSTRPDLSDEVVMTVRSPVASFWRGEVFDLWDGTTWTRSRPGSVRSIGARGYLQSTSDDVGARGRKTFDQTFQLVAPASTVIFAAPSPVSVGAPVNVDQRSDGSLVSGVMGPGTTYTVTSRREPVTRTDLLNDNGPVPESIRSRFAAPPIASDRTVANARRVTRTARTTLGKVEALEAWMGRTTEYSIKAPTARPGSDVVDDFLFESRQGWCEQIASSLVVLLRSVGVPARLATGFVPGTKSLLTDTYTVRANEAHAWAEVWFPSSGWQSFDPTAQVPLSGNADGPSLFGWLRHNVTMLVAVTVGLAAVCLLTRRFSSRRRRRRPATVDWVGTALSRLEALGRPIDRSRRSNETATAYGGSLAERLDAPGLARVGRLIDDDRYRVRPLVPAERAEVDSLLSEVEQRAALAEGGWSGPQPVPARPG